jgi:hypothetical protein
MDCSPYPSASNLPKWARVRSTACSSARNCVAACAPRTMVGLLGTTAMSLPISKEQIVFRHLEIL